MIGHIELIHRAVCGCGIWKAITSEKAQNLGGVEKAFEASGWTLLESNPTCVRCTEMKQLPRRLA